MLGYEFEIIYKKGKQNMVAGALSRKEEDTEGLLCAISILQSIWMEEVLALQGLKHPNPKDKLARV